MRIRGPLNQSTFSARGPRIPVLVGCLVASCAHAEEPQRPDLPFVHVDPERRFVEVEAEVIGRDAEWLELLVCTAGGREHEALLRTPALPSHVNLGLLLLGLAPGRPAHTDAAGVFLDAQGPAVRLTVRSPDDAFHPVDAGAWLLDRDAGRTLADAGWLYAGSLVLADAQGPAFLADVNGTLASLVSFGDDLLLLDLAAEDTLDAGNDGQRFVAADAVPPAGTPVRIRIEPIVDEPPAREPPFDTGPVGPDTPRSYPDDPPAPPQEAEP